MQRRKVKKSGEASTVSLSTYFCSLFYISKIWGGGWPSCPPLPQAPLPSSTAYMTMDHYPYIQLSSKHPYLTGLPPPNINEIRTSQQGENMSKVAILVYCATYYFKVFLSLIEDLSWELYAPNLSLQLEIRLNL